MELDSYVQKMCCFYASDWHLTVMLLPYINKMQKNSIYIKCENSIKEKLVFLLKKVEVKNKDRILKIICNNAVKEDWDNEENNEKIFIVSGNDDYIAETNKHIEDFFQNKQINIKIINCYEVNEDINLLKIIKDNDYKKMINTKGEIDIKDVFKNS